MKDLIKYIAQALVDHPDQVFVSEIEGNQTSVLELKVAKEDLGKVIGKQGRTARAMRTILSAARSDKPLLRIQATTSRRAGAVTTFFAAPLWSPRSRASTRPAAS